jgi:hypothetical protein
VNVPQRTYSKIDKDTAQQGVQRMQSMREQMIGRESCEVVHWSGKDSFPGRKGHERIRFGWLPTGLGAPNATAIARWRKASVLLFASVENLLP